LTDKEKEYVIDREGNRYVIFDPPFYRQEFEDAYRYIIDEYEITKREIGIFIPCAIRKPYSSSPSHKLFRSIFGTCGTVPAELELMYPFAHYHYMLGKTTDEKIRADFHEIEVRRLTGYLEKTRDNYKKRIAYCIGPFRKAMVEACGKTGIEMKILPSDPMIDKMYDIDCPFPEGSLSMDEYINEFREGLAGLRE
jgi:archaeosine synthase